MSINFEQVFSIHDDALTLRGRRSSILASNIANADTPGYKARDIDFKSILQSVAGSDSGTLALAKTRVRHLSASRMTPQATVLYRNPLHPSLDGNTVDAHVEQVKFGENSLMFQTSFTLLNSKIKGLMTAIRGE